MVQSLYSLAEEKLHFITDKFSLWRINIMNFEILSEPVYNFTDVITVMCMLVGQS